MDQEEALFEEQETVLQLPTGTPDQMAKALLEGQMGVTDSHMHQVLQAALSRGGDYADLYFEYAYRTSVVMEESIIKNSSISISKRKRYCNFQLEPQIKWPRPCLKAKWG